MLVFRVLNRLPQGFRKHSVNFTHTQQKIATTIRLLNLRTTRQKIVGTISLVNLCQAGQKIVGTIRLLNLCRAGLNKWQLYFSTHPKAHH